MIRIVLDTNIFISSLLQPRGIPAEVLTLVLVGERVRLCISAEIYSEYEEVIRRPRFRRGEQEIVDALRAIRERGLWIKPSHRIQACSDPDDDVFLECADAAKALSCDWKPETFPRQLARHKNRQCSPVSRHTRRHSTIDRHRRLGPGFREVQSTVRPGPRERVATLLRCSVTRD